jgi:hypothetical protein
MPEPDNNYDRAIIPVGPHGVELKDLDSMFRFARCYIQSGLAPSSFRTEQQLVIAWAKAAELGLSPLQATDGMAIINNRVGLMGDLALAMVESSGLLEKKRVIYSGEGENLLCEVTIKRKGRDEQSYSFSVREAKQAGIYDRSPVWRGYPRRMTYYRALGFALRDEFSDILKGTKTTEELADYGSEPIDIDEAKIAENQRKDEEIKIPGAKFVETKGKRPTPAEAAEPAFSEDKAKPAAPAFARGLEGDFPLDPALPAQHLAAATSKPSSKPEAQPAPAQTPDTEDDLDMGSPEAPQAEGALTPPLATDSPVSGVETPEKVETPWKSHVILGVTHAKFHKRKVGDLNAAELGIIENQWLPAVREQWDDASDAQRADAAAFESAIAYQKMVKPW